MTRGILRRAASRLAVASVCLGLGLGLGPASTVHAQPPSEFATAPARPVATDSAASLERPAAAATRPVLRREALTGATPTSPQRPGQRAAVDRRNPPAEAALDAYPGRIAQTNGARLVGVAWSGTGPDRSEIRFRTADGGWSPWATLERETSTPEGGTSEPLWIGDADTIELRASRGTQDVSGELTLLWVTDPATPAAASRPSATSSPDPSALATPEPSTGSASLPMPGPGRSAVGVSATGASPAALSVATPVRVYTRAEWGADESLRIDAPSYADELRAAFVHHTDGSNTYTADQVPSILRSIYVYHVQGNGWNDIGYNALVDRYGRVWEGRYGGLDFAVIGAHAAGFNNRTFGVSVLGTYTTTGLPAAAAEAVAQIVAWKFRVSGVTDPTASTVLTSGSDAARWPTGTAVTLPRILGHRDVNYTSCPGDAAYATLPSIRQRVAALVAASPRGPWVPGTFTPAMGAITSWAGTARVVMQGDGNLVVYDTAWHPLWATMTMVAGSSLVGEADGNLVLRAPDGRPLWTAGVSSTGSVLRILDDGDLVLYSRAGTPIWDAYGRSGNIGVDLTKASILHGLTAGQSVTSPAGNYRVSLDAAGTLAVRTSGGSVVWSRAGVAGSSLVIDGEGNLLFTDPTGYPQWTAGVNSPGSYLLLTDSGNLVLYALNGRVLWDANGSSGNPGIDYARDAVWKLAPGGTVSSPGGGYRLAMQNDGNLVVYTNTNAVVWATYTFVPGSSLAVGRDGSMRILDASGRPRWAAGTWVSAGVLLFQADGNLVLYTPSRRPVWDSKGVLGRSGVRYGAAPLWSLGAGQESVAGGYRLAMQGDGNLVVYNASWRPLWYSGTFVPGTRMEVGTDGIVRLTTSSGTVLWTSRVFSPGAALYVQADGNVVLYDMSGRPIFDTAGYTGNSGSRV